MHLAYLCYEFDNPEEAVIKFDHPSYDEYKKVIMIAFNVLHSWSEKDEKLYSDTYQSLKEHKGNPND